MKRSELIRLIKQQIYKQKQMNQTTNIDFKDVLSSSVRQSLDIFFGKYYFSKDAIKIIQKCQPQIDIFVNNILSIVDKQK